MLSTALVAALNKHFTRFSALSIFLALQAITPCHSREQNLNDNVLKDFFSQIDSSSQALNLWYSNYCAKHSEAFDGDLHDLTRGLILSDCTLNITSQLSDSSGGGVALQSLTLDNMHSTIFFKNNLSLQNGGGIYVTDGCSIINNHVPICFDHNLSSTSGGGIYSKQSILFENNTQPMYFLGNSGCAIRGRQITIQNCGPTLFIGNINGGIYCDGVTAVTPGPSVESSCCLYADLADILFYRNSLYSGVRKALQTSGSDLYLGAQKGYAVRFYDPIEAGLSTGTAPSPSKSITINKDPVHRGSILFSAMDLSNDVSSDSSRFSYLRLDCQLNHGTLCVADKAGVFFYKFTQDQDGILCLGDSAVIGTTKTEGSNGTTQGSQLTITNLALDLAALAESHALPPRLWITPTSTTTGNTTTYQDDTNASIILSGRLTFADMWGNDSYDSLDLSQAIIDLPLLNLWDNTSNKISIDDFDPDTANLQPHYGYQGFWRFRWVDQLAPHSDPSSIYGLNSNRSLLCGSWTPRTYIRNPKYDAPLIANTIWGSIYALMPGMHNQTATSLVASLYGQLTGMVHVQRTRHDIFGYHMRAKAYWVGAERQGIKGQRISLNFGQTFSHMKEEHSKHKVASKNYGATLKADTPLICDRTLLSLCLGYAYGAHDSTYSYASKRATGSFATNTIGASASIEMLPTLHSLAQASPFVEVRFFQSLLSSFEEQADLATDARHFSSNHPFWDFTTPIGLRIKPRNTYLDRLDSDKFSQEEEKASWSCAISYLPTWIRRSPSVQVTKVVSRGSWATSGTQVARHAISVNVTSDIQWFSHLKTSCNYEGTYSMTTFCNYMSLKGELTF